MKIEVGESLSSLEFRVRVVEGGWGREIGIGEVEVRGIGLKRLEGWGQRGWSKGSWGQLLKVMPKYGKISGYRS